MKKILSISLILLLLLGNLGITFGTHYCMGIPINSEWMIGQENMGCGMGEMDHDAENEAGIKMDCCDNEYVSLESVDEASTEAGSPKVSLDFVAAFFVSLIAPASVEKVHKCIHCTPVILSRADLNILHQVFRI